MKSETTVLKLSLCHLLLTHRNRCVLLKKVSLSPGTAERDFFHFSPGLNAMEMSVSSQMTYYVGHVATLPPWHDVVLQLIYFLFLQLECAHQRCHDFYPAHGYVLIDE